MCSGTGSNCRPSAFQVNRAKHCADLRKTACDVPCPPGRTTPPRAMRTPRTRVRGDEDDGLDAVAEAEFDEDAADVGLDGVFLDGEFLRDLGVGEPPGDMAQHLSF